jgi:transketolase
MTTSTESTVELSINTIRTLSMDAVEKAKSGHPGAPMALAPLAFTLYTRVMRHSPDHPDWFNRDRCSTRRSTCRATASRSTT